MLSTEEFNQFAEAYMDTVFRVAFSCLKSRADAEDVTQEVLLRLYETDHIFDSSEHVKNWMIKVTYNACRKFWRRAFRRHEDIDAYIEQLVFEDRSYQDLFAAVMKLDRAKRVVVLLYYIEGYQIQEIAQLLEIPQGTVGTRLARARRELRTYLEEEVSI